MPTYTADIGFSIEVASRGTSTLGFSFDISSINYVATPIAKNIFNEFDDHGLLLDLKRLPGEKNADYKRRLLDVLTNKASSTYRGLINGITRELGLDLYKPLTITARRNLNNDLVGGNPVIEFDGPEVRVWDDFLVDEDPELTIDRFALNLNELVDAINASAVISVVLNDDSWGRDRAMRILNQSSMSVVFGEHLQNNTRIKLNKTNILPDSVFFAGTAAFQTAVDSVDNVLAKGDYYLDRDTGFLFVFSAPGHRASIRYKYLADPLELLASPVILHNINSNTFKKKLFDQLTLEDGTETSGLPTALGTDLIGELLSLKAMLYGR